MNSISLHNLPLNFNNCNLLQATHLLFHKKTALAVLSDAGFSLSVLSTRRQNVTSERWVLQKRKGSRLRCCDCPSKSSSQSPVACKDCMFDQLLLNIKCNNNISRTHHRYLQYKETHRGVQGEDSLCVCWMLGRHPS